MASQVVEMEWKIPGFRHFVSVVNEKPDTFFSSVSRLQIDLENKSQLNASKFEPACPIQMEFFISTHVPTSTWHVTFCLADRAKQTTTKVLNVKFMYFNFFRKENDTKIPISNFMCSNEKAFDLSAADFTAKLFTYKIAENYLDTNDGSLNIDIKFEVQFPLFNETNSGLTLCVLEVLSDFGSLLDDSKSSDVKIEIRKGTPQVYHCHKVILSARSPVFRAMFESRMMESESHAIKVEDIDKETMKHFLCFIYSGGFRDSSWIESLPELTYAADKYCVKSLKNFCDSHLILCVNPRNALPIAKLAERHGLTKATKLIRNFISKNAENLSFEQVQPLKLENVGLCSDEDSCN